MNFENEYDDPYLLIFLLHNALNRWLGNGTSGMAILEIGLLSGFAADKFSISQLGLMKRVEDGDKKIILYFDEV